MNIIDLGILAVIFISILLSMYYGFSVSFLNMVSFIFSWLLSLVLHPFLTRIIVYRHPDLLGKVIYYSEGSSKIAFEDKILSVSQLTGPKIGALVENSGLPNPFAKSVQNNLANKALVGLDSVGQYFDYTVANLILNLASFILLFFIIYFVLKLAISVTEYVSYLPVLKKYDYLTAAGLGFCRGLLFLSIIFAFMPLLYLIAPADFLGKFLGDSKLANFFIATNFFSSFAKGIF